MGAKLKRLPEDFVVTELLEKPIEARINRGGGKHAVYRLHKESIGTPEALAAITRQWNIAGRKISSAGLKDRHARTSQHITIYGGPQTGLQQRSFELEYLGQIDQAAEASWIRANRFEIRLRNITAADVSGYEDRLGALESIGVLNYFDDQRFGSLGESGEPIAAPWCRGDYERAVYLMLAEPTRHDTPDERGQKAILREHWGDWVAAKAALERSHRRSVVTYLVDHPTDFRRALALVRRDLRSIYAAAFQSLIWNRWLSAIVEQLFAPETTVHESRVGLLHSPRRAGDASANRLPDSLPLPSGRVAHADLPHRELLDQVLEPFAIQLHQMRFRYPRDTFFSKADRRTAIDVHELRWEWAQDDLYPGRQCLQLSFQLPRGAYATAVIRRLQQSGDAAPGFEEPDIADD